MNITIKVPDDLGKEINRIPNHDELATQALKNMLEKYRQTVRNTSTSNKWKKISNRVKKNPPLRGAGEKVLTDSKDFRNNFNFNND